MDTNARRDELVSTIQVARRLGIHRVTAAMIIRQGRLPATKVADRWVVRKEDLEEFARTYQAKQGRPFGWSPKQSKEEHP